MSGKEHISLFELQNILKNRLEKQMPLSCWVTAEISEFNVGSSGHCYMELVEKGGNNQVPKARVMAMIWGDLFGALSSYFHSTTGRELSQGLKVLMKVRVVYHHVYGLSLTVTDIDPLYTLGDIELQRQQAIDKLKQEGVYDMNRMLELPPVIQRIAVLSSRSAAGYQDFMNELAHSPYELSITLFDSFMQGAAAEQAAITALEQIAERLDEFDIVVVVRGGGSQSDLAAFDSYRICSHLAQFPIPIVTGIGHDKDQSVADLVANVALKTPTAVATWLVSGLVEFEERLNALVSRLGVESSTMLEEEKRRAQKAAYEISQRSSTLTRLLERRLERLLSELKHRQKLTVLGEQRQVEVYLETLVQYQATHLKKEYTHLQWLLTRVEERLSVLVEREQQRVKVCEQLIESRRPEHILSLGFAIVSSAGKAIKSSSEVEVGDMLNVQLFEGRVSASVAQKSDSKEGKKTIKI